MQKEAVEAMPQDSMNQLDGCGQCVVYQKPDRRGDDKLAEPHAVGADGVDARGLYFSS